VAVACNIDVLLACFAAPLAFLIIWHVCKKRKDGHELSVLVK
jgi:hypothetical protein